MTTDLATPPPAAVDLFWLPLGAGDTSPVVRWSGRAFETIAAHHQHRAPRDLYHSALEVRVDGERHVVEMVPVWADGAGGGGVVGEGPVGLRELGRARLFRYEVHNTTDGVIPDVREAVGSPVPIDTDPGRARRLLALVHQFPTTTWGRDEVGAGEMWNSNSLTSWLLAASGHATGALAPPAHGRAPGWEAGLVVAARRGGTGPSVVGTRPRPGSAPRHRLGGATRQEAAAVM
ncbi:MAG: hypothetical protein JWR42_2446, partial [Marmoricola sp.]|nr:hypothetical protein [Marmoricola sp.]